MVSTAVPGRQNLRAIIQSLLVPLHLSRLDFPDLCGRSALGRELLTTLHSQLLCTKIFSHFSGPSDLLILEYFLKLFPLWLSSLDFWFI